jgi:L-lactate utilization protein LutC
MDREAFLDRVRHAAVAGRRYEVHARREFPARCGYTDIAGDWCERLVHEIRAVGGFAHPVPTLDDAHAVLAGLCDRHAVRSAVVWQHPLLERLRLDDMLRQRSIARIGHADLVSHSAARQREQLLAADIGITSADYALAETGTLALFARPGQERLASLLPPVHVAIVERSQVLADLFDLFALLEGENLPSNLVLITGPSKTGDVELKLTTGVHGPRELHVVVVG